MEHIRFQAPELPSLDDVQKYWTSSEKSQWFSNGGPCLNELKSRLVEYVDDELEAVPVSSATAGLLVALSAVVEPGQGPYVIVPSYTFAATAAIVHWTGLKPLFVDIDGAHWHTDPAQVEQALRTHHGKVAAAVLCATYGTAPPAAVVQEWERICREHGIPLVVDSAAGFGSRGEDGRLLGSSGDAEVFSFHATKPFAIGEGGVVMTRSEVTADRIRRLVNFGFNDRRIVDGTVGLNGKMDELHAALALSVLDRFDHILEARQTFATVLRSALEPHGFVFQLGGETSSHQFLPMLHGSREQRDRLIARAAQRDIELRAYFGDPLHRMPSFNRDPHLGLDVTDDIADRVVCLPIYNTMSEHVLQRVIDVCVDEDLP